MTNQPKRSRKKKPPEPPTIQEVTTLGEILGPDFIVWYKANYDEQGKRKPGTQMPGLRPPKEEE